MMGKKGIDGISLPAYLTYPPLMHLCEFKGLYALAARDMFGLLHSPEFSSQNLAISVSLFEIYGNKIFDLLNERNKIVARQDAKQRVLLSLHKSFYKKN